MSNEVTINLSEMRLPIWAFPNDIRDTMNNLTDNAQILKYGAVNNFRAIRAPDIMYGYDGNRYTRPVNTYSLILGRSASGKDAFSRSGEIKIAIEYMELVYTRFAKRFNHLLKDLEGVFDFKAVMLACEVSGNTTKEALNKFLCNFTIVNKVVEELENLLKYKNSPKYDLIASKGLDSVCQDMIDSELTKYVVGTKNLIIRATELQQIVAPMGGEEELKNQFLNHFTNMKRTELRSTAELNRTHYGDTNASFLIAIQPNVARDMFNPRDPRGIIQRFNIMYMNTSEKMKKTRFTLTDSEINEEKTMKIESISPFFINWLVNEEKNFVLKTNENDVLLGDSIDFLIDVVSSNIGEDDDMYDAYYKRMIEHFMSSLVYFSVGLNGSDGEVLKVTEDSVKSAFYVTFYFLMNNIKYLAMFSEVRSDGISAQIYENILDIVCKTPGITNTELRKKLTKYRKDLPLFLETLVNSGNIVVEKKGKSQMYFPSEEITKQFNNGKKIELYTGGELEADRIIIPIPTGSKVKDWVVDYIKGNDIPSPRMTMELPFKNLLEDDFNSGVTIRPPVSFEELMGDEEPITRKEVKKCDIT